MSLPVLPRQVACAANHSAPAAPADRAEPDAAEAVALEHVVLTSQPDPLYSDDVQHPGESRWTEAERQAFLRRVQYVDPRERRA